MMNIEHGTVYDDREIRRKLKKVIPKAFENKLSSLGKRWYSMSRDELTAELKMDYESIKNKQKKKKKRKRKKTKKKSKKKNIISVIMTVILIVAQIHQVMKVMQMISHCL